MNYLIYCDGACSGNGKLNAKGGWGAIVLNRDDFNDEKHTARTVSGYEDNTTNQRMELMACLESLKLIPPLQFGDTITVRTDSAYLCNCFNNKWYKAWLNNGWKTASKQPVKNQDLWKELITFFENPMLKIEKVKGHAGDMYNELVDQLAVEARKTID